jgi:tetratricopeptide (TPR) repeat protein
VPSFVERGDFAPSASLSAWRLFLPAAAIAVLAGCSGLPSADRPAAEAPRERPQAVRERAPIEAAPVDTPEREGAESAATPFEAPVERRRRDYPEIETDEAGFTITEQIRIAGDVRTDYDEALQYLRQESYERGIALLLAVTEKAPDVTAPYIDLGIAYGHSGELELAEAALTRASQLSPGHPIVHNELGILFRKTGRFAEARASYETALQTYPSFHYARRNLAVLCDLYLADLVCALEHYEAYMESVVDDEQVEIWIADIRNRIGQ